MAEPVTRSEGDPDHDRPVQDDGDAGTSAQQAEKRQAEMEESGEENAS